MIPVTLGNWDGELSLFASWVTAAQLLRWLARVHSSLFWAYLFLLHAMDSTFCNTMPHLPELGPPWQVFQVFSSNLQVFLSTEKLGSSKEVSCFCS